MFLYIQKSFLQHGGGLFMGVFELGNQSKFKITGSKHEKTNGLLMINNLQMRLSRGPHVIRENGTKKKN